MSRIFPIVVLLYSFAMADESLLVKNGSGSGDYAEGATVTIVAAPPPPGGTFAMWRSNGVLANPLSRNTTVKMQAGHTIAEALYYEPKMDVGSRGYHARPCGFDLNDDGVIGQVGVDDKVSKLGVSDPDSDGVNEDIVYVDSYVGNDATGNGSQAAPYATISKAMSAIDGPGNNKEDIICIHGVFSEKMQWTKSGVTGLVTRDGFEYPRDPMMIIGWDKDGDGEFPPYDDDDEAVLDGLLAPELTPMIENYTNRCSHLEMAHLTIRNWEGFDDTRSIFVLTSHGATPISHLYFHDIEMDEIHTGPQTVDEDRGGSQIVFDFFTGATKLEHVAVENILVNNFGGFFSRGECNGNSGHFQFHNLTLNGMSRADGALTGFKMWGLHNFVEIAHCVFDGQPEKWPYVGNGPLFASVRPDQQDVTIRDNIVINSRNGISVVGYSSGYGNNRPVDRIYIEDNFMINTYDAWGLKWPIGIYLDQEYDDIQSLANIYIRNNFFFMPQPAGYGLYSLAAKEVGTSPHQGHIYFENNTIYGCGRGDQFYGMRIAPLDATPIPIQNFTIKKNVFVNLGVKNHNIYTKEMPTGWNCDENVFDPGALFTWNKVKLLNFSAWQTATGEDAASRTAVPKLVNPFLGDLIPAPEDIVLNSNEGARLRPMEQVTTPVGVADIISINEDATLAGMPSHILTNDTEGLTNGTVALLLQMPAKGSLDWNQDGSFTYRPNRNFFGSDSFLYRIRTDDWTYSQPTLVTISIQPVNDSPETQPDSYVAYYANQLNIPANGVLVNDIDPEGDTITAVLESSPTNASAFSLQSNGSFTYAPAAGFLGVDEFKYRALGPSQSEPQLVRVSVIPAPQEITLDNTDPKAIKTGEWITSTAPNHFGSNSVYSNTTSSVFTWYPSIPIPGYYAVYAWWTYHINRSTNVPFFINHSGGAATVNVNMRDPAKAGRWQLLGWWHFPSGEAAMSVSGVNGQSCADAIQIVRLYPDGPVADASLHPKLELLINRSLPPATAGNLLIHTVPGMRYRLESSTTLMSDNWQHVQDWTASSQLETMLQDVSAPKKFYRAMPLSPIE